MQVGRHSRGLRLKLAAIVLAGGGAAFLLLRPDGEWTQSDAPETGVPFICLKDGHTFQITPARFQESVERGAARAGGPGAENGSILTLECPQCRQMSSVRAEICPNDMTTFARRLPDGAPGRCPKCNWSFYR